MFGTILKKIKKNGATAIVRFAYDDFNGDENLEPSLDMILRHIEQICPILTENKDVISYVELGFFGPWGEMHSSDICTPANVTKALNLMLANTPEDIKIGVRQPKYYVDFAGIDRAKLNGNITVKGTKEYRVGLFNDGYLGSHSDLGTFENREIEVSWLENQALHTLYGGEIVATRGNEENDKLNSAEYMSKEAFRTHTTYLNSEYDDDVINAWKDEIYNGDDELYKGKDGYLYIANHMGYRFVLRNSNISMVENNKIKITLDIENVGFANLVNSKKVSVILESDSKMLELVTDLDPTTWNTRSITNLNMTITVPDDFEETEYKAYLRISKYGDYLNDNNYQCIRIANNNIWDETLGANFVGQFDYKKIIEENPPSPQEPDDNKNDDNQDVNNPTDDNPNDNQSSDTKEPEVNKPEAQEPEINKPKTQEPEEIKPEVQEPDNNLENNDDKDSNGSFSNNNQNNDDEPKVENPTANQNTNNNLDTNNAQNSINEKNNVNKNTSSTTNITNNSDNTVSSEKIPYAGVLLEEKILIFFIILLSVPTIYFFKKL